MEFVGVKPEASSEEKAYKPMKHSTRVVRHRDPDHFATPTAAPPSSMPIAPLIGFAPVTQLEKAIPRPQQRPQKELDLLLTPPKSLHVKPTPIKPSRHRKRKIIKVYMRRNSTASPNLKIIPLPLPPTEFPSTSRQPITDQPQLSAEYTGSRPYVIQVTRGTEHILN